jgi:hypothetical protein
MKLRERLCHLWAWLKAQFRVDEDDDDDGSSIGFMREW